jgi:uncharacterized cupin superfamily protein
MAIPLYSSGFVPMKGMTINLKERQFSSRFVMKIMVIIMNIIVKKPTEKEIADFGNCPVWECKPSTFNWYYDSGETCLVIEGDVTVEYDGCSVSFTAGDLVIFPKGLTCIWNVKKTIKKHYMLK